MNTIRKGSSGNDVKQWQGIIGVIPDGSFGPATESATKAWQAKHKLVADGVVGPASWGVAIPRSVTIPTTLDPNNIHVKAKKAADAVTSTPNESMFVRGVAWHETNYGLGWKPGEGAGSFNMGAITTQHPDSLSFQHGDSRNDTGQVIQYTTWFKGWPSFEAGMKGLADFVLKSNVKTALKKGDIKGATDAMYANKYYLGIHPRNTSEGNAANEQDYFNAVSKAIQTFAAHTGESVQKLGIVGKILGAIGIGIVLILGGVALTKRHG